MYPEVSSASATCNVVHLNFTKMPAPLGYVTNAETQATGLASAVPEYYSYGTNSPFLDILPCYLGWRGSMMWHFNISTNADALSTMLVQRLDQAIPTNSGRVDSLTMATTTSTTSSGITNFMQANVPSCAGGSSLTNQRTQTGMSVLCPHYYPNRFCDTNPTHWLTGSTADETGYKHYKLTTLWSAIITNNYARSGIIEKFYSIGPDFNAFFFLNVPVTHLYVTAPVSPT